jgi:2,3-bisphosphoglycerate-dependent phosphoglycerate mutase
LRKHPALTVLLVRHAEPVAPGTAGFDEFTRPLTAKGMRDAEELGDTLAATSIVAAYSSPYIRARQTIEPIASARGLSIKTIEDLRERLLSPVDIADWRAHLRRSWEDFDYAPAGGESGRVAQARVMRVMETIASTHRSGTVIVASHGNLIALALHAIMPKVDYEFWESIAMPAVFAVIREGSGWRVEERVASVQLKKKQPNP